MAELLASGGLCRICNRGMPEVTITVDHRTYVRLGLELPGDLTSLCEPCHAVVTDMLRRRMYERRPLPAPTDVPPVLIGRVLVDFVEGRR